MSLEGEARANDILRGRINGYQIDDTLTVRGASADAKATGDAIKEILDFCDDVEARAAAAAAEAIEVQVALEMPNIATRTNAIVAEQTEQAIENAIGLTEAEIRAICI